MIELSFVESSTDNPAKLTDKKIIVKDKIKTNISNIISIDKFLINNFVSLIGNIFTRSNLRKVLFI